MGFFDTKIETKVPKEYRPALKLLTERATEAPPDFPERQVAGIDPLTELAQKLVQGYMQEGPSQAYTTALDTATQFATQSTDPTQLPEYRAVVDQIADYGQLEANRLQRGNIMGGVNSVSSSAGRDVLGRSVTGTQERMMAAAVPFLQQARAEKQQAITQLQSLDSQRQGTLLNQVQAGTRVGDILRGIEGAKLEAEYLNKMDPITFRYETQPQLAGMTFGAPMVATQQPSDFAKYVAVNETLRNAIQGGISGASNAMGKMPGM